MIDKSIIFKIIGSLLFIGSPTLVGLSFHGHRLPRRRCSGLYYYHYPDYTHGNRVAYLGRNADNNMSRRDAYLVVTLSWIIFSFFGTLPFIISGYIPSFTDAYFETMSGFTTTGATIIDDVDKLPHGLLFWRSMTQWIGGLGIVSLQRQCFPRCWRLC